MYKLNTIVATQKTTLFGSPKIDSRVMDRIESMVLTPTHNYPELDELTPEPWDQQDCGSCYCIAALQCFRGALSYLDKKLHPPLSEIYTVALMMMDPDNNNSVACGGGNPVDVNAFLNEHGVPEDKVPDVELLKTNPDKYEKEYSKWIHLLMPKEDYQRKLLEGVETIFNEFEKIYKKKPFNVFRSYDRVIRFDEGPTARRTKQGSAQFKQNVKKCIKAYGSVIFGFEVYTDFSYYWNQTPKWTLGGKFTNEDPYYVGASGDKGKEEGGHAVTCIGWNDKAKVPYWIIRNSWGKTGPFKNGLGRFAMFFPESDERYNEELALGASDNKMGGVVAIVPDPDDSKRTQDFMGSLEEMGIGGKKKKGSVFAAPAEEKPSGCPWWAVCIMVGLGLALMCTFLLGGRWVWRLHQKNKHLEAAAKQKEKDVEMETKTT